MTPRGASRHAASSWAAPLRVTLRAASLAEFPVLGKQIWASTTALQGLITACVMLLRTLVCQSAIGCASLDDEGEAVGVSCVVLESALRGLCLCNDG